MFRRFNFIFAAITVFGVVFADSPVFSELTLDPKVESLFMKGIEYAYQDNMKAALARFDSIEQMMPESPVGAFSKAFTYDLCMDEYRSLAYMDEFNKVVSRAIRLAEKQVQDGKQTAETQLFLGAVYGIRGVRKAMLGDWWGAYKDARNAIKGVEKSVEIDSTLYDAYYGIGNYHYWKSARLSSLLWIPFIKDEREQGIEELYLTIEKGKFAQQSSRTALIRIFIEEKRWQDCINTADELIGLFEPDLQPRWGKAYSLIKLGRWQQAISVYDEAYRLLTEKDYYGEAGLAEIWYYTAFAQFNSGNYEEAEKLLNQVFPLKDKVNEKLFFFENVFLESEKLLKQLNDLKK